jgi:hypothetical protein
MRVASWQEALYANVETWRNKRFDWATWSCCHLAAAHVLAMTGVDYLSQFPAFTTRDEAYALLGEYGGIEGLITSVLGGPVHVSRAKRGDVVVGNFGQTDLGEGLVAGVCLGVQSCAPGARGLVFMPTADAVVAWRVI